LDYYRAGTPAHN